MNKWVYDIEPVFHYLCNICADGPNGQSDWNWRPLSSDVSSSHDLNYYGCCYRNRIVILGVELFDCYIKTAKMIKFTTSSSINLLNPFGVESHELWDSYGRFTLLYLRKEKKRKSNLSTHWFLSRFYRMSKPHLSKFPRDYRKPASLPQCWVFIA